MAAVSQLIKLISFTAASFIPYCPPKNNSGQKLSTSCLKSENNVVYCSINGYKVMMIFDK